MAISNLYTILLSIYIYIYTISFIFYIHTSRIMYKCTMDRLPKRQLLSQPKALALLLEAESTRAPAKVRVAVDPRNLLSSKPLGKS